MSSERTSPQRVAVARPGDLEAIVALELRCFGVADRFSRATWRHLLGPAARRGSSLTLVVREGGLVVGSVNGLFRSDSALVRIYSLAVDPSQRGKGLARALILALLRRAPRRCATVTLEVRAANEGARRLYEGLGFAIREHLPAYYPDGGDGIRYRASLAAVLERGRAPESSGPRLRGGTAAQ